MAPGAYNEGFNTNFYLNGESNNDVEDVVIAGAGPAGLMLATNLARYGIKPVIVDDRADRTSTGRADGLQPKTIETLRQFGLADSLIRKGVRIYDICFWSSTEGKPLRRTARENHFPEEIDAKDPYILLVHQGMIEDVFLEDLQSRNIHVTRSAPFASLAVGKSSSAPIEVFCDGKGSSIPMPIKTRYLVGSDGAHSKVRKCIPGAQMEGESGKAQWGVLDGVIETDFPDLWSKVVIRSDTAGTILCIPRERNMTRLYIELDRGMQDVLSSESSTQEFVMRKAEEIIYPFKLKWTSVEWFSVYKVGQRVANRFTNDAENVFIVGDAAHTHSPKAAQGMNVSMHDSFNLAWKLNLAVRGLALPNILSTYQLERRKIAQDLINFDFEHANAFANNDMEALAQNFATNIGFISGMGARYDANVLNRPDLSGEAPRGLLRSGSLILPTRVSRYIDANPIDLQLDIPMLGQFIIFIFTSNTHSSSNFLTTVCNRITSLDSVLGRATALARESYKQSPAPIPGTDVFPQLHRYTMASDLFTPALITTMPKADVELSDLPPLLSKSGRWTFYLDNITGQKKGCTEKWLGGLEKDEVVIVNVRPDRYVGSIGRWKNVAEDESSGIQAAEWLDDYYGGFLAV